VVRTSRRPSDTERAVYVPVYTLHEMNQEIRKPTPIIICSGCGHEIPAPKGDAAIQCRDCGRKMQVKSISPTAEATRANPTEE
jgi:DNA-directed RNA polymerase subunit RPC12/RpoP